MNRILSFFSVFLVSYVVFAQELKPSNGVPETKVTSFLFKNATILVSPEITLKKGSLLVQNDRIAEIGNSISTPANCVVIDCEGKTIVPAFIELNSSIGMPSLVARNSFFPQVESNKQGAYYWNESIHPEVEPSQLFTFDEKSTEERLKMGFGFALTHVNDGIASGYGSLISLGKSNYNKQLISPKTAAFFSFEKGISNQTYPSSQMGSIALLRQTLYDLEWYSKTKTRETNLSLDALEAQLKMPLFFSTKDRLEILRASKIGSEFNLKFTYIGSGNEYESVAELIALKSPILVPLHFPKAFDVKDPYISKEIPLSDLKHWELAPSNPVLLTQAGIQIALSAAQIDQAADFWKNLHRSISRGLSTQDALKALTTTPAELIGMSSEIGTLEKGKRASFMIYDSNPFEYEAKLLEAWTLGEQRIFSTLPQADIRGTYNLLVDDEKITLKIAGTPEVPTATAQLIENKIDSITKIAKKDTINAPCFIALAGNDITLQFTSKTDKWKGSINFHGKVNGKMGVFEGDAILPSGKWSKWSAIRNKNAEPDKPKKKIALDSIPVGNTWLPNMAFGFDSIPKSQVIVIENATVWTNEQDGIIENATVVVNQGKITFVGKSGAPIPTGAVRIDAKGKHLTSGIIDEHSHIAISKGVNESGQSITAEVNIGSVVTSDDINIYRQLSGGVTAAQLLHGSANAIGGQSGLIKLKWGFSPENMLIPNAPKFIKCALGENVKQANWGDFNTVRFPQTRMGVEQVFYDAFERARAYESAKKAWHGNSDKKREKLGITEPRVDLELEVLVEILNSERFITCHSYIQSEINMLMHVADSMGFTINTFTHILEGYKIADKMKKHGVGGSTFADWWAYKFEVIDAIPQNAAMMHNAGIVTAINSDDAEMGRRLNQEAGKIVKYGGISQEDAWKMVTLNPAKLLHLDDRMGSIKVGKDADLVLWTSNPLSIQAVVEKTMIDGLILYDATQLTQLEERNAAEKARIISTMLQSNQKGEPTVPFVKKKKRHFHCDTHGEEGSEGENHH